MAGAAVAGAGARTRRIPYKKDSAVHSDPPNSDINVTPLVDVCLVLLIIFMVITPMLGRGRDVRLPVVVDASSHKEGDQVFVSVDDDGAWVEQDIYNTKDEFITRLEEDLKVSAGKAAARGYTGPILFIKGDILTKYGRVRTVMEWINGSEAGIQDIALVVDTSANAEGG